MRRAMCVTLQSLALNWFLSLSMQIVDKPMRKKPLFTMTLFALSYQKINIIFDRVCMGSCNGEKIISFLKFGYVAGRTPDSPESVRAVAPRSPISPKLQYTSLPLQRTTNGSTSPIQKGGSTTPPQTSSAASIPQASTPILLPDTTKELSKLRKFLGALYQFGQDTSSECGDRVRSLILSLVVSKKLTRNYV